MWSFWSVIILECDHSGVWSLWGYSYLFRIILNKEPPPPTPKLRGVGCHGIRQIFFPKTICFVLRNKIVFVLEHDIVVFFDTPYAVFGSVHVMVITFDRSLGWKAVYELVFVVFVLVFKFFIEDEEYFALGNKLETFFVSRFIGRDSVEFVV